MRTAFDGSHRRRIHLFRHGDVSYVGSDGTRVADSTIVELTPWGQEQARLMRDYVREIAFDRAVCSGMPRTIQTAEGILGDRGLEIEHHSAFREISSDPNRYQNLAHINEVAYAFKDAHLPSARYGNGEAFGDFAARVIAGLEDLLADPAWNSLALVAHGGVNRAILGWASGAGLAGFSTFEQNTCCLNIIDVDTDPQSGTVVRKLIRGVNLTPYDPVKKDVHLTALEMIAERMAPKYGR